MADAAVDIVTEVCRRFAEDEDVEIRPLGTWTVRDGKVVDYRGYMDFSEIVAEIVIANASGSRLLG